MYASRTINSYTISFSGCVFFGYTLTKAKMLFLVTCTFALYRLQRNIAFRYYVFKWCCLKLFHKGCRFVKKDLHCVHFECVQRSFLSKIFRFYENNWKWLFYVLVNISVYWWLNKCLDIVTGTWFCLSFLRPTSKIIDLWLKLYLQDIKGKPTALSLCCRNSCV